MNIRMLISVNGGGKYLLTQVFDRLSKERRPV